MSPTLLEAEHSPELTTAHPPHSDSATTRRAQPVRLLDRLALRLGLALIVWSRRTAPRLDREALARRRELLVQLERERRDAERRRLLLAPRL